MTVWEFKDLNDKRVVSTTAAREVGRVHEVLFNPRANALFGLVVTPTEKGGPLLLVPQQSIRSIGKDAITVESLSVLEHFDDNVEAKEISAADGYRSGMDVMTESGESVGKVDKVTVNDDGTVASYHSTTGFFGSKHDIEPSEVISGSEQKLIISDDAREGAARTVMAQGAVPPSTEAEASSMGVPAKDVVKASESPAEESSPRNGPTQGVPDNSMFTKGEIHTTAPSETQPRVL